MDKNRVQFPELIHNLYDKVCAACSRTPILGKVYIKYCLWESPTNIYLNLTKRAGSFLQGFGEGIQMASQELEITMPAARDLLRSYAEKHNLL